MIRHILLSSLISGINSLVIHRETEFINRRADQLQWTALGDSYSSGVGSTDYVDGRRCLRYNESYPVQLNGVSDLAEGDHIFNNCACSGALASEIAEWQLLDEPKSSGPNWEYAPRPAFGDPSFATLTAGGDDIDFPGIIFNCILDWHKWYIPIKRRTCDDQRAHSWELLNSPDLVDNLDSLMKAVVKKGRSRPIGDKFKLYVTGYARFFSTETRECDPVTFARDANPKDDGKEHPRMTKEVREDFNKMSDALNQAVQDAVGRNKETGVTFIDIQNVNGEDKLKGHRYCGPGVTEPDTGNTNLYFWHYPYNEADDSKEAPIIKLFTDKYNEVVGDLSVQDSVAKWPNELDLENAIYLAVKEGEIPDKADSGNMALPGWDSIGWRARVFHPQVRYHAFIRDRILAQYKADTSGGGSPGGFVCGADAKFTDSKVASWYQALGQFIPEEPEWTVYNMDCGRANNLIPQNDNGETCGTCNPCEGPNALFGCGEKNGQTIFQTMVAGGQHYNCIPAPAGNSCPRKRTINGVEQDTQDAIGYCCQRNDKPDNSPNLPNLPCTNADCCPSGCTCGPSGVALCT